MILIMPARVVTWDKPNESAAPEGPSFHIHVTEHEADEIDNLDKSNKRVVNHLNDHGILGEKMIVTYAVHVDAREVELLTDSGTWVTHQPHSNINNGIGTAE